METEKRNTSVIISGSTGGIGKEISKLCLASDKIQKCIFLYKNEEKYQTLFGDFNSSRVEKYLYNMESDFQKDIIGDIFACEKEIKLILNAFTIEPIKHIADLEMKDICENININILAQLNLINTIVKWSKNNNKELYIVNMNSGAAYKALKGWSLYSGAKAYINIYLKTLVAEEALKIVSYDPGVVNTPMQKIIRETEGSDFEQKILFEGYLENNLLRRPELVAADIFKKYISNWTAVKFEEQFN